MEATVSYNDFRGTAAADISDALGGVGTNDLEVIGRFFKLDETRFKMVGLSIYGTGRSRISLICVDNEQSKNGKDHIVKMSVDVEDEQRILDILFKRLHILLFNRHDKKYPELEYDEEVRYDEFHDSKKMSE